MVRFERISAKNLNMFVPFGNKLPDLSNNCDTECDAKEKTFLVLTVFDRLKSPLCVTMTFSMEPSFNPIQNILSLIAKSYKY